MYRSIIAAATLAAFLVLTSPGYAQENLTVELRHGTSSLAGFSQIPAGGQPGSSSLQRPDFQELGIDAAPIVDLHLQKAGRKLDYYTRYSALRFSGKGELSESLVTREIVVPAGSQLKVDYSFDTFYVGLQKTMNFSTEKWTFKSRAEVMTTMFDYVPVSEGIDLSNGDRRFNMINLRLGLNANYRHSDRVRVAFNANSTIPGVSNLQSYELTAEVRYLFFMNPNQRFYGILSVDHSLLDFEDNQEQPNFVMLKQSGVSFGLAMDF